MLRPLVSLFAIVAAMVVVAGCDPVTGFWDDITGANDDNNDGNDGRDAEGEGEGGVEGDGDPSVLAPAPTFVTTTTNKMIDSFALNSSSIGHFFFEDPYGDDFSAPRRLLFGTEAGTSFTEEVVFDNVNGSAAGHSIVIDNQGRAVMWSSDSGGVGVAVRKGPRDWEGDDLFTASFSGSSFVSGADVAAKHGGGFVAIVATAINTTSETNPNCSFNITCRDYSLAFVEGDVGAWSITSIASHMGEGLGVVRAGVNANDEPILVWTQNQQLNVATKNSDGEIVSQVVAADVSDTYAPIAFAPNGDVHAVYNLFGGVGVQHAHSTPTGFLVETLPALPGIITGIAADDLGTVHMVSTVFIDATHTDVHYSRARGELFDDVVAGTIEDVDSTQVGLYPHVEVGADGGHIIEGYTGTYIKPE